jgi:hypothetical protein
MSNKHGRPARCAGCDQPAWVKDRPVVELVDLGSFGRPARLLWHKHRWCCPAPARPVGSWTSQDPRIAAARLAMTDRAGQWATLQIGRNGRTVNEVARALGCDWHTVNDAVIAYGTPLIEDPARIGAVTAVGLDEVLRPAGPLAHHAWSTTIAHIASYRRRPGPRRDPRPVRRWGVPVVRHPPVGLVRADRLAGARPVRPVAAHLRHDAAPGDPGRRPVPSRKAGQPASRRGPPPGPERDPRPRGRKHDPLDRSANPPWV